MAKKAHAKHSRLVRTRTATASIDRLSLAGTNNNLPQQGKSPFSDLVVGIPTAQALILPGTRRCPMAELSQVQIGTDTSLSVLTSMTLMSRCALSTLHIPIAISVSSKYRYLLSSVIGPRRRCRPKSSTSAHPASSNGSAVPRQSFRQL